MWAAVFFGMLAANQISLTIKIFVDTFTSLAFITGGLLYFMVKGKIPFPNQELMNRMYFWFGIAVFLLEAGMSFYMNYLFWVVKTINGIQVVTYIDLISLFYGGMGVFALLFMVQFIRREIRRRKTKLLSEKKVENAQTPTENKTSSA
jgi:hypothetical protein